MNNNDRGRLLRIANALEAIPFGHDGLGGPTVSLKGAVGFQHDMRQVRQHLVNALRYAGVDDLQEDFEEELSEAEAYIEKRRQEQWA